jgi:hypothetical protein
MSEIETIDGAKAAIAQQGRRAVVAVGKPGQQVVSEIASCYGGVFHGRHGEEWPVNGSKPLIPWLQVVSRELPLGRQSTTATATIVARISKYITPN